MSCSFTVQVLSQLDLLRNFDDDQGLQEQWPPLAERARRESGELHFLTLFSRRAGVRDDSGMSHLMRAQLGFCPKVTRHEPFDKGSARILCGGREPKW